MSDAKEVAKLLTNRFMADGRMVGNMQGPAPSSVGVQFAAEHDLDDEWEETRAFTPLLVLSVGHWEEEESDERATDDGAAVEGAEEEGRENVGAATKGGVIIYATNATNKLTLTLPSALADVPIRCRKVKLLGINPEEALTATAEPRIFMHDGRVCCGSSCAAATGAPGTLGALVRRANDDKLYMMSCNHVIAACNQVPIGIPILSPAPLDAQPFGDLPRAIARLSHAIPLRSGVPGIEDPCEQDVALAALLDEALVSSKQGGSGGFDTPVDIADLKSGMKVKKFGRSSGLTHGVVESVVEGPWAIPCVTKKFKGSFWFKNFAQVVGTCKAFAIPGDSGSLVVTEDGTAAVGLVFSSYGGGEATQILPIRSVLGALGATLVNGHHI